MIEIVALFVACKITLVHCVDLPYIEKLHKFEDPDVCRAAVVRIVKKETAHRKKFGYPYPIVMGHCKWHLNEESYVKPKEDSIEGST